MLKALGRKGTEHAAAADIVTGFKPGGSSVEHPPCGQHPFLRARTRGAHRGRGIRHSPRRFVGGRGRFDPTRRKLQPPVLNRLAQRVVLDVQLPSDFLRGLSGVE